MAVLKLSNRIYSVGVLNPNLRVFDVIMATEYGTTYNAFLVKGDDKIALIDTVHEKFWDEFYENVQSITDITKIDYLICNHTEPDHTGSIKKLLAINPKIKIIASPAGSKNLIGILNMPFESIVAKDNDVFALGGLTLKTISAPMLHWPDSIFTWCEEEKTMFSCDFLAAHYAEPRMFDHLVVYPKKYNKAIKDYFDAIFSPFKPFVLAGLDKIEKHQPKLICPSHGPLLRGSIASIIDKYLLWGSKKKKDYRSALIVYVSSYGYTEQLAYKIKEQLAKNSIHTEIYNVIEHDMEIFKEKINEADLLFIGSPTINRDALKPIWDIATSIDPFVNKGKLSAVFGSYGWSGEGVPMIVERLKSLKLNVSDGFVVNFQPNKEDFERLEIFIQEVIDKLK